MEDSWKMTKIKSEITEELEIPFEMEMDSIEQENNYLNSSEVYIKTELKEDTSELPMSSLNYFKMPCNDNMEMETKESMIKVEGEDLDTEIMQRMQDPLEGNSGTKVERNAKENSPSKSEANNKLHRSEEGEIYHSGPDDKNSHANKLSIQNQLLVINERVHRDKKIICNVCNKKFGKICDLNRHFRIHSGEKPYVCGVCEKSFTQKTSLDIHTLIHSGEKPHVCNLCNKGYRHKSTLNNHMLTHSGEKPHACDECNQSFVQKTHLVIHKRIHNKQYVRKKLSKQNSTLTYHKHLHIGKKPHPCDLCQKTFVDESTLIKHRGTHTEKKPYAYDVLKYHFIGDKDSHRNESSTQNQLSVANEPIGKDKKFICKVCNKKFAKLCDLNRHFRVHSGEKPYMCGVCEKSFGQKISLDIHMLIHSDEKPHVCNLCNKGFRHKSTLHGHMLIHSDEKSFTCKDETFAQKPHLKMYEQIHKVEGNADEQSSSQSNPDKNIKSEQSEGRKSSHSGIDNKNSLLNEFNTQNQLLVTKGKDKKYTCSVCNKKFKKFYELDRHFRIHSGEKPYVCGVCEKSFTQKNSLDIHTLIHSGDKPHVCNLCNRGFRHKSTLHNHMLIHSGEKPHACDECGESFVQKTHLAIHKRIHRRDK